MEMYTREKSATLVDDIQDEPAARVLLRKAFDNTARWQKDFTGFSARLRTHVNGTDLEGLAVVRSQKDVSVILPDDYIKKWVQNQLAMIAAHRVPRNFDDSDGKYVLTIGPEDGHPFGKKLLIHGDEFHSYYRIKDGRLTQINRTMPHIAFSINVEESARTLDGFYLTTKYTVYYRSPDGKKLENVESITDTHVRVGSSDLPATRRVISFENGDVVIRTLSLDDHQLIDKKTESVAEAGCPVGKEHP